MALSERYAEIVEQCEARIDELNEWEQSFILGDGKKSSPLRTRDYLSKRQKEILERIECERLLGQKWNRQGVQLQHGAINAEKSDKGWLITVANYPVGEGITKKEAGIVTYWLHGALAGILSVPKSDVQDYLDGLPAELPEPEEVEEEDKKDDTEIPF